MADLAATWRLNVGPGLYQPRSYGTGAYGVTAYSAGSFAPDSLALMQAFAASQPIIIGLAADLSQAPIQELAGALAIQPAMAADLVTPAVYLDGALAFSVGFNGDLSIQQALGGAWALGVSFVQTDMALDTALGGAWSLSIDIPVPPDVDITTGPLWGPDALCPAPLWTTSALCPPPPWRPETNWQPSLYGVGGYGVNLYGLGFPVANYAPSVYGTGAYGVNLYGLGQQTPFVPIWTPSELCHA